MTAPDWRTIYDEAERSGWTELPKFCGTPEVTRRMSAAEVTTQYKQVAAATFEIGYDHRALRQTFWDIIQEWKPSAKFSWYFGIESVVVFAFMSEQDAVDFRLRWPW